MTRIQRRLLIDTAVIGVTLTSLVAILDYTTRTLAPLESWFYDRRARLCQRFAPPPTDKLVHLDIDDASLDAIGRWPWDRAVLGQVIDEINRYGARAIALDLIFSEPSRPRYEAGTDGGLVPVDDDAAMADAVLRGKNVLVPLALTRDADASPVAAKLREYLTEDLELTEAECHQRLLSDPARPLDPAAKFPTDLYLAARRQAMNARLARELEGAPAGLSAEELRRRLLPKTGDGLKGSGPMVLLAHEHARVQSLRPLDRFMIRPPQDPAFPSLATYESELAPVPPLSRAARATGYVNYLEGDEQGVIRSMPLFAAYRGKLCPQIDLVMACLMLGVDPHLLQLHPDKVVIPRPAGRDRDIVIPVRVKYSPTFGRRIGMIMDVPARGGPEWQTIYDYRVHKRAAFHVPLVYLWEARQMRLRVARNNGMIDRAISAVLDNDEPHKLGFDPDKGKAYAATKPAPEDTAAREAYVAGLRKDLEEGGFMDLKKLTDAQLANKPTQKLQRDALVDADNSLTLLLSQNRQFAADLAAREQDLKARIGGRGAYVGWTAIGKTDFFPTAAQNTCPGVVIHGQIYNAIMTGDFWRRAPKWVTLAITIALGLVVTAANGFLKPVGALVVALLLGAGYLLVNGYVLFDYGNWVVGAAGPMVVIGTVWSTGAIAAFLIEATERARITKRFRTYVDPKLVDYMIENPEASLDGQVREMSVVFTDLAGFTTLSEKLRERTVGILSEYLGRMVPLIRRNDGFVNKFLGDGIMCFFNAPRDDPAHAVHAVTACLDMQAAMRAFADELEARGLPRVAMRCGVSTGTMVVGDSGPEDACDFTVLGDNVNLASRLEGANKAAGTAILVTRRTADLCGEQFLWRPVGKLRVVGKSEGVQTCEPLARADEATAEQREVAELSGRMVGAFQAGEFARCVALADELEGTFGTHKLAALYRKASKGHQEVPPGADFDGTIVLTEK